MHTERGYFYIVSKTKRLRITTDRVLASWSPPRVVETTENALAGYKISFKMKFRNGSLIHNIGDGKIYLIENGKRRHVVSPEAFERVGVDHKKLVKHVVSVSLDEINLHEEGEPLT